MERYRLSVLVKDIERGGDIDVVIAADAQRALDAEREKVAKLEKIQAIDLKNNNEYREQLATLQAQLARWKEALGEWLWNCTNLLGDYHIKTVQDFNEEVNRRIAWLMQHLDHTLPPPMTDEERDRMRKLSEDNAALQADNECKDSLIETLQAQLRQVEGERDEAKRVTENVYRMAREDAKDYDTLRQLVEALINSDTAKDHDKAWFALRATLAAKDAPHPTEERS